MKHIIEYSQIEFFKTQRYLELEGVFNPKKIEEVNKSIEAYQQKTEKKLFDPSVRFLHYHDLFRTIESLKKVLTSRDLIQIMTDLTQEKYLRLVFDQLLIYPIAQSFPSSLNISSDLSFQGLTLGMLIQLDGASLTDCLYFPKQVGNVVFFDPTITLDLQQFLTPKSSTVLLVGFGGQETRYRFKESDPHTHLLKNYGYVFGDGLTNAYHPLLIAK